MTAYLREPTATSAAHDNDARCAPKPSLFGGASVFGGASLFGGASVFGALAEMAKSVVSSGKDWLFKSAKASTKTINGPESTADTVKPTHSARELLTRAINFIGVSRLMGLQHAAFLSKMLRDFDSGNFSEALRRAIPLGGGAEPGANSAQKLGFLRPQHGLTWTSGIASAIGVSPEFVGYLAERYRACFRALDQAGRIEEAAYVLIELLRETDEDIEYLARHGAFYKAAELAQARALAPARVVRLWLLAGEKTRALRHARVTRCFAAALQILADRPEIASTLRLEWAQGLAAAHQYAQAVAAIWPAVHERGRAKAWLAQAKLQNHTLKPQLIACELALDSDSLSELAPALNALLDDASEAGALERERFAYFLLSGRANVATQRVAPALIRALLADFSRATLPADAVLLHQLEKHAQDPLWNADRARGELSELRASLRTRSAPLEVRAALSPEQLIFDVLALPNRRYLVALGDAGAVLVGDNGRRLHYFKSPAHQLISDTGSQSAGSRSAGANGAGGLRVIALAHRQTSPGLSTSNGHSRRVDLAILDLHTRTEFVWCSTVLSSFARRFDGQLWVVGVQRSLMVIDVPCSAEHKAFEAIWHVGELPGNVDVIDLNATALRLLLVHPVPPSFTEAARVERHVFEYRWPELSLAKRHVLQDVPPQVSAALHPATFFFDARGPVFYVHDAQQPLAAQAEASKAVHLPHQIRAFDHRAPWRVYFPVIHTAAGPKEGANAGQNAGFDARASHIAPANAITHASSWLALQFVAANVATSDANRAETGWASSDATTDSAVEETPTLSYLFDLESHKPLIIFAVTGALPTLTGDADNAFCLLGNEVIHVSLESAQVRRFSI